MKALARKGFSGVALALSLLASTAAGAQTAIDLNSVCRVDVETADRLIRNWDRAPEILIETGVVAAEYRECILTLVPEALADVVFTRSPEMGLAAEMNVLLKGLGVEDVLYNLRAFDLFAAVEQAYINGDYANERILEIIRLTGAAEAALKANEQGKPRSETKVTISFVSLRHDGTGLILIAE